MPFSRDTFRQWVEQNTPPATEESRRWWAQIMAQVSGQTLEQMELGRQAWAAEQERDAQIRRQRIGQGSQTTREPWDPDWLNRFDRGDGPKAV
jgi:hypothetical protein